MARLKERVLEYLQSFDQSIIDLDFETVSSNDKPERKKIFGFCCAQFRGSSQNVRIPFREDLPAHKKCLLCFLLSIAFYIKGSVLSQMN